MPRIEVILNAASGPANADDTAAQVKELFAAHGIDVHIHEAKSGVEILDLARKAADSECEIIVAGGGDGTVSAVASALLQSGKTLGVLPLGTLNHFAKDLQIPLDLKGAVNVIAGGKKHDVDVGEVNGRIFINNSSIGLYPDVVRGREMRQRLGYGKWQSLVRSAFKVFRRYPLLGVRLTVDGKDFATRTPFVFIGNNEYQIESFNVGARHCLDDGKLSVYMTRRAGKLALIRIAIRAIIGGLSQEKDFLSLCTDKLMIETRRKQIRVAMDGEVLMMATPLTYLIRAGALSVVVPESFGSGDRSGDSGR